MSILFTKAANGETACTCDAIRLHSAYNPGREAERFVQSVSCEFTPGYILVTGPALSYSASYFKKRFPDATLCAVHYTQDFKDTDSLWDKVFLFTKDNEDFFSEQLFDYMGEEGISCCLFTSWQPSEKAFASEHDALWQQIKKAVLKSRDVLATRSYFARRWVRNTLRFCALAKKTASVLPGNAPVLVCASGPSLKDSLPFIKKYRDTFFLLAVSSAIRPLIHAGIVPDACISTDGGYWAKQHLSFALKAYPDLPVALSPESACYAQLFEHPVIPLSYGDGISEDMLRHCGYRTIHAQRNGTVSGTAAELALSITSGTVFFCGLDLAPSHGFAHTQPNELELTDSRKDFRLRTAQTRTAPATFPSASLEVYASWFAAKEFGGRLFRLSASYPYVNTLGTVKDVNWDFFASTCSCNCNKKPIVTPAEHITDAEGRIAFLHRTIRENMTNPLWIKEALTAQAVAYERSRGTPQEQILAQRIAQEMDGFYHSVIRSLGKAGTD